MIAYFARHPTAANLLMAALILLGLVTLPKLQRDTFPLIPPTEVEVRIAYPGAAPAEVEAEICLRAEDALDGVSDLDEVRCEARDNLAIVTARMEEGGDMPRFLDDVKSRIGAIGDFPDEVEAPVAEVLERVAVVAGVMITADTPPASLERYAEQVRARLLRDPRIAQVTLRGFSPRNLVIEVPLEAQQRYGLDLADFRAAIERQNLDLPAGVLCTPDGDLSVRVSEQRADLSRLADLVVISSRGGGRVRLGDVARIGWEYERPEQKILFNGRRAALLEIAKTEKQDALRVMAAIQENLVRERRIAPRGVAIEISQDVTINIRDRLRILLDNGIQGLVLVFVTLWLFFGLRYSFWVAMGLPVSFLGAIFFMHLLGYTLNMMTLVALLVAIGLLMDDAIVIAENVAAHSARGRDALRAAVEGTRQVFPGVVSSFLTTAMIVGPLAFMAGKMGAVLKYIPAVLLIALAVSLIEAFLILPAHLRHAMGHPGGQRQGRFRAGFNRAFDRFRDRIFGGLLTRALAQPWLSAGLLLGLALLAFATIPAGLLKYRALPELESNTIQARVYLPQGTPLWRTEAVVERLLEGLEGMNRAFTPRQPGERSLVQAVTVLFDSNVDAHENGPHVATVSADLLRAEERVGSIPAMLEEWRRRVGSVPDVLELRYTDQERGVAGKPIDIRLQGERLPRLEQAAAELKRWLDGFRGVLDLSDDLRPGRPEYRIVLREAAGPLGIDARDLAEVVRAAVHGATGMSLHLDGDSQDLLVRLESDAANGVDTLYDLPLRTPSGRLVPLAAVAEIRADQGYSRINRVDGQRTVTVQGALETERVNARELMGVTKRDFLPRLKERYPDVRVSFVGQGKESATTGSSLQSNLAIGLAGVFIILSFQFRSYLLPLAVMLSVPMGLVGVVAGHLLMGLELSMPSLVGLATLIGIVVNDSILLVAFIRQQVAAGMPATEAAQAAARDRFRAVVLTSATTIAGLLPLLLETSNQAQFLIPLVASLAFGLLSATVLSLFLIPVLFVLFGELGWLRHPPGQRSLSPVAPGEG